QAEAPVREDKQSESQPRVWLHGVCAEDHLQLLQEDCRSALMEQHLFWKFEGAVVSVALVFACLVIIRQRQLDRKALEKVRKQIESI
ncbi:Protein JTB, partial [Pteropus alecto]